MPRRGWWAAVLAAASGGLIGAGCAAANPPADPATSPAGATMALPAGLPSPVLEHNNCGTPVLVITFSMPPPHEPSVTPQSLAPAPRAQTAWPLPRAQPAPVTPQPLTTPNYHPTGSPGVPAATPC